jgi:hypothetical protein
MPLSIAREPGLLDCLDPEARLCVSLHAQRRPSGRVAKRNGGLLFRQR